MTKPKKNNKSQVKGQSKDLKKITNQTRKKVEQTESKPDQSHNSNKKLLSNFIDHINSILNSNLFRGLIIITSALIILFSLLNFWEHKRYQISLLNYLPEETTIASLEVNQDKFLTQYQLLQQSPDKEQIQQLVDFDNLILNQTTLTPTLKKSSQKIISYQLYNNQSLPTFLYKLPSSESLDFPAQIIKRNSDQTWHYLQKGEVLIVSPNPDLNQTFFDPEVPKINTNSNFIETLHQVPSHNLAWFTINHQNLKKLSNDTLFPRNPFSNLSDLIQTLSFTTGYLQVNQQGLFIGTYTNPSQNFNLSPISNLDKFQPKLHQFLPPLQDIDFIFSGTELSTIVNTLLDNINQSTSNPTISLKNFFTRHNLSPDHLSTANKLFSKEYLVYKTSNSQNLNLILPKQSEQVQQEILDLASALESFNSPVIKAYQLPDGSIARNQVPSPVKQRVLNEQKFPLQIYLKKSNKYLSLDFTNPNFDKISYGQTKAPSIQPTKSLTAEPVEAIPYINLLEEGSSHFYSSSDIVQNYLNDLDLDSYPFSINSSSYFFNDGLQTLFQLTW
jgi:hypothetical protein